MECHCRWEGLQAWNSELSGKDVLSYSGHHGAKDFQAPRVHIDFKDAPVSAVYVDPLDHRLSFPGPVGPCGQWSRVNAG